MWVRRGQNLPSRPPSSSLTLPSGAWLPFLRCGWRVDRVLWRTSQSAAEGGLPENMGPHSASQISKLDERQCNPSFSMWRGQIRRFRAAPPPPPAELGDRTHPGPRSRRARPILLHYGRHSSGARGPLLPQFGWARSSLAQNQPPQISNTSPIHNRIGVFRAQENIVARAVREPCKKTQPPREPRQENTPRVSKAAGRSNKHPAKKKTSCRTKRP